MDHISQIRETYVMIKTLNKLTELDMLKTKAMDS